MPDLSIDLLLVAVGNLESNANDLCLGWPVLVGEQPIDDSVARVHVALLVEVELAAVGEIAGAEREAAWLAQRWVLLRDLAEQFEGSAPKLLGGKVEELLLGGGIEELDREPRHLQAELRRVEARLARDIGQLNPFAGVLGESLANFL